MMHFEHPISPVSAKREMHISKPARDRYALESSLFSLHGSVILADIGAAQRLAHRINEVRDVRRFPESAVQAGELYAAGLIDELLHLMVVSYLEQVNANAMTDALEHLSAQLGEDNLDGTLRRFAELFPATPVYTGEQALEAYLSGETDGTPHRTVVLEELLMLYIANENPALGRFRELFDDADLEQSTAYPQLIDGLEQFFEGQPGLLQGVSLFEMLRAPSRANPTSLEGQLEYMRQTWSPVLGERFERLFTRVLQGLDVLKEESKPGGFGGPGPARVLEFGEGEARSEFVRSSRTKELPSYERFSPDSSWMPRVVMLAKSTYVWLDQLSKRYERDISRLDQIPDEELDELARRGFTSLWLIGLWERSEASKRIKNLRGQPDAVASAYALYDYQIAHDLGGEAAYESLRDRTWGRGIRLASDMVPNHVGVDGRWVLEHPDWFLQLDHAPYPGYTFNGPDLSSDERVGIFIEDHYFDNSDAAVVFKRVDRWTGEERYIYHGNDGTVTPWNDTAQINYLSADVREAVIQTILHVARKFSVIRFDAAMTLAKIHVQRLWFPEPGEGGAIPSRAQYGSMTNEEFERHFPEEFWREVVDRVAEEVPDTLLLAEAFWMMEPYFVRTLGMHRVYNSAFMHMFMDEENAKYRLTIKNTLEFNPEILKRFVNFMSNPDEETAIGQFGKDDKYFGVCTVMVTMPGLPMFGHGQVEGFHEKYGMEYRRAKMDEMPDGWLIERHYREIFPLVHRRKEFAEVDNFLLYDFYGEGGRVNENVFAYSNSFEGKASLVVYNNTFADARGWLKRSAAYREGGKGDLRQRDISDGLGLGGGGQHFVRWREHVSGLEHLRPSRDVQQRGLYLELGAFKYQVFLDVHEVFDENGLYRELYEQIGDRGVPSLDEAIKDSQYQPLYLALDEVVKVMKNMPEALSPQEPKEDKELVGSAQAKKQKGKTAGDDALTTAYTKLLKQASNYGLELSQTEQDTAAQEARALTTRLRTYPPQAQVEQTSEQIEADARDDKKGAGEAADGLAATKDVEEDSSGSLEGYRAFEDRVTPPLRLRAIAESLAQTQDTPTVAERLRLPRYAERSMDMQQAGLFNVLLKDVEAAEDAPKEREPVVDPYLNLVTEDEVVQRFLEVNEHAGERWFNQESYRLLSVGWAAKGWLASSLEAVQGSGYQKLLEGFLEAEKRSGYKLGALLPKTEADEVSATADASDQEPPPSEVSVAPDPSAKQTPEPSAKQKSTPKDAAKPEPIPEVPETSPSAKAPNESPNS